MFECDDPTIVMHPFEYDGVAYLWLVNAWTGDEYDFYFNHVAKDRTTEKLKETKAWENREIEQHPTCRATLTYDQLSGIPYDLIRGRRLEFRKDNETSELTVEMDRWGGSLVAFYQQPVEQVRIDGPKSVEAMSEWTARITVAGASGPMAGTVPIEIAFTDPKGRPSVLCRSAGTEEGIIEFTWVPAINDIDGTWTLAATELASGISAEHRILLR
jgi:hypothetical protein